MPFQQSSLGILSTVRAKRTVEPRKANLPATRPIAAHQINRRPSRDSVVVEGVVFGARMWQVFELLADGVLPKEIAFQLGLVIGTVKVIRTQAYAKVRAIHPALKDLDMSAIIVRWAIMRRLGVPIGVWRNMDHPDLNTFTFPPALLKETPTDA